MAGDWGSISAWSGRLATSVSAVSRAQPILAPSLLAPADNPPVKGLQAGAKAVPAVQLKLDSSQGDSSSGSVEGVLTPALTRLMGGLHRNGGDATNATANALQTLAPAVQTANSDSSVDGVRLRVGNYRMSFGQTGTVDMLVVEAGLTRQGQVRPDGVQLMTLDGRPLALSEAQVSDGLGSARYRSSPEISDGANDSASVRLRDAQNLLASLA